KLLKTLSLDKSRSPEFNLFSDLEEYSEEEVAETMAETMEQYMIKTRADYGSGIGRPKIKDNDSFELKGQFLKELHDNTFSSLDHEDANEHIEKVLEIVDLFHIPNITHDQVMLRAFHMSLTRAKMEEINNFQQELDETLYQAWEKFKELLIKCPQHYLTEMQEVILFYNGLEVLTRQILDSKGAIPSILLSSKRPHYTKYFPLNEEGKTLEEAYYTQFGGPFQGGGCKAAALGFYQRNNANPSYQERIQSMEETLGNFMSKSAKRHGENSNMFKEIRSSMDATIRNQGASIKTLKIQIGRPFLSTAHAKIDVFKRKITLRVRDEKIVFKSVKPASSLIKRVYMLGLRERMELDLEARLMGETLVLNRSLDPLYRDYIKLNDLNIPLELRRNQVDNLMPTIEEGEVIDEPMIDIIKTRNNEGFDEEFYNSIIKDKVEYKGKNVVGAFMNVPIFVRNFLVVTHFVVVENIDDYRDQDMRDIILENRSTKLHV
ncbi:hypothetical protein Tco_1020616, partial [Tanacetum coccineum]